MAWLALRASRSLPSGLRFLSTGPGAFAGIPGLSSPDGWATIAGDAASKCRALVDAAVTSPPSLETVRILDEISDTLCQVLDAAFFCQSVHADPAWRTAAERVCTDLGAYVHELNTNYALYTALKAAVPPSESDVDGTDGGKKKLQINREQWDEESLLVGRMLLRDFERYGVHLSGPARDRMASLVAATQTLGFAFTQNVIDPGKCGQLLLRDPTAAAALPYGARRYFRPAPGGGLLTAGTSAALQAVMTQADDEDLRRAAYEVYCTNPTDNLAVLDQLIAARHEIATLMGFPSFAAYQLDGFSLAGVPAAVDEFLEGLSTAVAPAAAAEAGRLSAIKHGRPGAQSAPLRPWDRDWAMQLAYRGGPTEKMALLDRYMTLEGAVAGLSAVLGPLLGVEFWEATPAKGELWAPGVRKLLASDAADGSFLGVVYLDLCRRPGKFPGAAHFTLRCGRELENGEYQTPVVALVANFRDAGDPGARLGYRELETLWHEFGHALNSLLSRTRFQHLSGTRGPQDVIEIPSHVFERLASDPAALATVAAASGDAAVPPADLLAAAGASKREFAALSLQSTLALCAVDQVLHGLEPPSGAAAEAAIADALRRHSALDHAPGAHPQLRFNHLVGYGSNYYSYLFAQAVSAAVWRGGDAAAAAGRSGPAAWPEGQLLRRQMLEPGGAKTALHYTRDLYGSGSGSGAGLVAVAGGAGWYPSYDALLEYLELK